MVEMDRRIWETIGFLLVAHCYLIGSVTGSCDSSAIDIVLQPIYSQLEAVKLLMKCQCTGAVPCSCSNEGPLGMEDGRIPNDRITASTVWEDNHEVCGAPRARLNQQGFASSWCNKGEDSTPWIQVDFNRKVCVTGVITQGRGDGDQWVTEFEVAYGDSGQSWARVANASGATQRFVGNSDRSTRVTTRFPSVLHTKFLRIEPSSWNGHCSMRFEVIGCDSTQ